MVDACSPEVSEAIEDVEDRLLAVEAALFRLGAPSLPTTVEVIPAPRCATCIFWEPNSTCRAARASHQGGTDEPTMELLGFGADGLETSPDFGCVLHRPRADT